VRGAVSDLYYNSWRFLGANVIVGILLVLIVLAAVAWPGWLVLLPLVAVPTAGLMRMATCLVRDGHTGFDDFTAIARRPWMVLVLAAAQCLVLVVLAVDVGIGGSIGSWAGAFLQVSALYGVVLLWAFAAAAWPLLLDPVRDAEPVPSRLRLALVLLVAHPIRVGGVLLGAGLVVVVAAVVIAPLMTFALALVWLGLARFVLPVADRLEGRATLVLDDEAIPR
jgi:hypothetical protein